MRKRDPVEVALEFVERINRADLDGLLKMMTFDHAFTDIQGHVTTGREAMTEGWAGYFSSCPDYMIHVSQVYELGEHVALVGRATGSHTATSRRGSFREPSVWIAGIRGDLVYSWSIAPYDERTIERLGLDPEDVDPICSPGNI